MKTVYDFKNSGRTQVKYKQVGNQMVPTKPAGGACFGYSLIWASKMVQGSSAKLLQPSIVGALPLQQKVEQTQGTWDQSVASIAKGYGFNSALSKSGYYRSVIRYIRDNAGFYIVDYGHHWVGMGNDNQTKWYYFDSNEGLLETEDRNDFYDWVKDDVIDNYKSDGGFKKSMNKAYKITA